MIQAVKLLYTLFPKGTSGNVFYEKDGYVSLESMHFTRAVNSNGITWKGFTRITEERHLQ
jgi:hypothetical protein